jgi:hypothetical protein
MNVLVGKIARLDELLRMERNRMLGVQRIETTVCMKTIKARSSLTGCLRSISRNPADGRHTPSRKLVLTAAQAGWQCRHLVSMCFSNQARQIPTAKSGRGSSAWQFEHSSSHCFAAASTASHDRSAMARMSSWNSLAPVA